MHPKQKLYVVTRSDLSAGAQAVQAGHAIVGYSLEYPEAFKEWADKSNYLCYLSVDSEEALQTLCAEALHRKIEYTPFFEPDLENALTAVCFEPTLPATLLCRDLKLALREYNEADSNSLDSKYRRHRRRGRLRSGSKDV